MSSLTHSEAVDEIYGMVVPAWIDAGHVALFEHTFDPNNLPETSWALFLIRHGPVTAAMGGGQRLFTRTVVLSVSVYVPSDILLPERYGIARILLDNLEAQRSSGGVWTRSVELEEIGRSGPYFECAITAEAEYYEIKEV